MHGGVAAEAVVRSTQDAACGVRGLRPTLQLFNTLSGKRMRGNAVPLTSNLVEYLKRRPHVRVICSRNRNKSLATTGCKKMDAAGRPRLGSETSSSAGNGSMAAAASPPSRPRLLSSKCDNDAIFDTVDCDPRAWVHSFSLGKDFMTTPGGAVGLQREAGRGICAVDLEMDDEERVQKVWSNESSRVSSRRGSPSGSLGRQLLGCTIRILQQAIKDRGAVGQKRKRVGEAGEETLTESQMIQGEGGKDVAVEVQGGQDFGEPGGLCWQLAQVIGCQALSADDEQVCFGPGYCLCVPRSTYASEVTP